MGLIGLHWGDRFIELVPWKAELEWEVSCLACVASVCLSWTRIEGLNLAWNAC